VSPVLPDVSVRIRRGADAVLVAFDEHVDLTEDAQRRLDDALRRWQGESARQVVARCRPVRSLLDPLGYRARPTGPAGPQPCQVRVEARMGLDAGRRDLHAVTAELAELSTLVARARGAVTS
jgi:hypothetical protein